MKYVLERREGRRMIIYGRITLTWTWSFLNQSKCFTVGQISGRKRQRSYRTDLPGALSAAPHKSHLIHHPLWIQAPSNRLWERQAFLCHSDSRDVWRELCHVLCSHLLGHHILQGDSQTSKKPPFSSVRGTWPRTLDKSFSHSTNTYCLPVVCQAFVYVLGIKEWTSPHDIPFHQGCSDDKKMI